MIDAGRSGEVRPTVCVGEAHRLAGEGTGDLSDEARCRSHLPVYSVRSRTIKALKLKLEASESEVQASELELEACGPVT